MNLSIGAGEVVAIVGENGSGKTTLAKMIAGLYRPDLGPRSAGTGRTCRFEPADVRRSVAVIFQDFVRYQLTARGEHRPRRPGRARRPAAARRAAARGRRGEPSSRRCPRATTPFSARSMQEAPTCRSGSGSGWPWLVRCAAMPRW